MIAGRSARTAPVLFVIEPEQRDRAALKSTLSRRFGSDYRVLTAASAAPALKTLERLQRSAEDVAVVLAALSQDEGDGIGLLERVHALHPRALRGLLLAMDRRGTRIPFGVLGELQRATTLGRIDFSVLNGWRTPEEWLYPQVQVARECRGAG